MLSQNSGLYVHYGGSINVDQLVDMARSQSKDQPIVWLSSPQLHHFDPQPADHPREGYLLSAAANSDLVVICDPLSRDSALTDGRTFVFSNYTATVDRVLWSAGPQVLAGQKIVISRAGGIIHYRDRKIVASVPGYELFHFNDPYAVFLRLLPNGSYLIVGESAYRLADASVITHPQHRDQAVPVEKEQFLVDLARALSRLHPGEVK